MNAILTSIPTALTAFTATNLDDVIILLLFFSQVSSTFRKRHIVMGQYLGFGALVLASLSGYFGGLLMPRDWIGMLGILPIAIGLNRLFIPETEDNESEESQSVQSNSWLSSLLSPQVYSVAAVTFANGGDNVGIYVPLFASSTLEGLLVTLVVFLLMVGLWCYVAYRLIQVPAIADSLSRYGNYLVPFVLIGLGILIMIDSHTLENRGLVVLSLLIGGLVVFNLGRNIAEINILKPLQAKEPQLD
ncbi:MULTISPECIES: cadmium resistance transporter [Pseudanabaena]|uniref:Cadmium resistance transporter n=2 Tax=Pseudanabaena TaxID=1152 RepID=L8MZZ3_9CYAN|nr:MULTISPECIES: cadmium resistance transporter [Pseudanabaena]ELS32060.1 cadmium resistance transporter [Pseudanabaena biceps PCC 7429]MDG3495710.1 cadmium resistance transporter [Pseudanabaena catenata USMAC16]